jgi:hypothetical protein
MNVTGGDEDLRWDAFVTAMLETGPAYERRSRYGDKPALFIESREIAHLEAPGVTDLRITQQGWSRAKGDYVGDPTVRHDASRRTGSSSICARQPTSITSRVCWL